MIISFSRYRVLVTGIANAQDHKNEMWALKMVEISLDGLTTGNQIWVGKKGEEKKRKIGNTKNFKNEKIICIPFVLKPFALTAAPSN